MMNQLQAAKKIFSAIGPVVSETIESLADDGRIDGKEALKIGCGDTFLIGSCYYLLKFTDFIY
jgi:hypothetical protein